MAEWDHFRELIEAQRKENREQFGEQRRATTELVKSVSELSSILARSEERHLAHDDGMKRISKVVDDHENRLRFVEASAITAFSSWKTVTLIGTCAAAAITIALNYWGIK